MTKAGTGSDANGRDAPAHERLAVIGTGSVAELLYERGTAAGWSVERVPLVPGEASDDGPGLVDAVPTAVSNATVIAIATPASAHHALTVLLRGAVSGDALVLLVPGQPGGALQFAHALGPDGPTIAETSWAPFVDVNAGTERRRVEFPAVPLATVPASKASAVTSQIAPLIAAKPVKSALWTALHAPDVVLKTIPMIVGARASDATLAGLLDGPGDGLVTAVELERQEIASALGLEVPSTTAWLSEQLETPEGTLAAALGPLGDVVVPHLRDPEWLADLAPFGLVPLRAIAADVGVETRCITALVAVADALLGNDYLLGGRSAQIMGLGTNGD